MRLKSIRIFCSGALALLTCLSALGTTRPKLPPAGVVPDEPSAVKIAEAVFHAAFGVEEVAKWQPYHG